MLSAAELERMLLEDRRQRAKRDHDTLAALGVVRMQDDEDDDDEIGHLDDHCLALLAAIHELLDERLDRAFDPAKHPRNPKGAPGGGRFRSMVDRLKDAIQAHLDNNNDGHPFDGFDREQLRRVARTRGITLKRGEDRDSIAAKLLADLGGHREPSKSPRGRPATGATALRAAPIQLGHDERLIRGTKLAPKRSVDALSFYAADGYYHINDGLREDTVLGSPEGGTIRAIDEAMAKSKLTQDIIVHRGVKSLAMFGPENRKRSDLTGLEFVERAYSSTTADPNVADEFFGEDVRGEGAILNIRVPAGVGAIQLSELGPTPPPDGYRPYEEEAEMLLDRGLTFRIVGDRVAGGRRHLDAEVVVAR